MDMESYGELTTNTTDSRTNDRCALVIGNNHYHPFGQLKNATNDAESIEKVMIESGFNNVIAEKNLTRKAMLACIRKFTGSIVPGGVSVVFFAGHGVQIDGKNYLIPTDADYPINKEQLADESIELNSLLDRISSAKPRVSILIIDACRNLPSSLLTTRGIYVPEGLAGLAASTGTIVIFSAGANQVALDGGSANDKNSIFVEDFIEHIKRPGWGIKAIVNSVRNSVATKADKLKHEQSPAVYDALQGDFCFTPALTNQTSESLKSTDAELEKYKSEYALESEYHKAKKVLYELMQSADSGDIKAIKDLAYYYKTGGLGSSKNHARAIEYYEKALGTTKDSHMIRDIHLNMAQIYHEGGFGIEKDYAKSIQLFKPYADSGESYAMRCLSVMYNEGGGGIAKDVNKALEYAMKSASTGDYIGATYVADIYFDGGPALDKDFHLKFRENVLLAIKLLEENQPNDTGWKASLYVRLGNSAYYGKNNITIDYTESVKEYTKAATLNDAFALRMLCHIYRYGGYGVKRDCEIALSWAEKGASLSDYVCATYIGDLYREGGPNLKKNDDESKKSYYKTLEIIDDTGVNDINWRNGVVNHLLSLGELTH